MTISLGPYESHGAYGVLADSDRFNTSGVGPDFCRHCEHDPCIAGSLSYCTLDPRFIVITAIAREITDTDLGRSPHRPAVALLTDALMWIALQQRNTEAGRAEKTLVKVRGLIRRKAGELA
jgi:hypothetical protein